MTQSQPNPTIFKVRRPNGKIYAVPEHNLDHALSPEMGGEIVEDDNPLNQSVSQTQETQSIDTPNISTDYSPQPQPKTYEVRRPNGKIYVVPENNLQKAKELGGKVVEGAPENNKYKGENSVAAFVKNVAASAIGSLPDLGIAIHNMGSNGSQAIYDPYTHLAPTQEEYPSYAPIEHNATDMISSKIDKATGGYTEDTGAINKHSGRFLGGLFGAGYTGKAIQAIGAAGKLGAASGAAEKTGSFVARNLGATTPSAGNVAGALAGGTAAGLSEENALPLSVQLPFVLGSFMLGKIGGDQLSRLKDAKTLQPLFKEVPGLQNAINKGHYEDLAKNINPDDISNLLKSSLIEKETEFLTKKTLSELPQEIRTKIESNPSLLTEAEVDLVVEKGLKNFKNQIESLEKEYFPLTTGEYTGSQKILNKEDALANKANVDNFDIAMKNRKLRITKRIEQIKHNLSPGNISKEELGEKTAKLVDVVFADAEKILSDNWNRGFGQVVDKNILSFPEYKKQLKEFSQLRPDNQGNKVAINAALTRMKDGILYEEKISPRRFNDILVGLNEDARRFPHKTFSNIQSNKLKQALEKDLTMNIENASTQEQASLIRKVRQTYAEDSKLIDQLNESILFKNINKDSLQVPERIAQSFDTMPASQIKLTFDALRRSPAHEEIIPQIQRYYIERALEAATKNGADSFSPRLFLDKLPKKSEFDVIFEGTNAYQEIKDISVLLKRAKKNEPSRHNSKTEQRRQADRGDLEEVASAAKSVVKGDYLGSLQKLLNIKQGNSYDRKIADILLSPEERRNVLNEVGNQKKRITPAASIQAYRNIDEE